MPNFNTPKEELDEEMREPMTDLPTDAGRSKGKADEVDDDKAKFARQMSEHLRRAGH